MLKVCELATPAFLLDKQVLEKNCTKMLQFAKANNLELRGQTKTHKTVEGAVLQTGGTKRKLVTSTLAECELYADNGFEDILYGFPLMKHHLKRAFKLREQLDEFHLMVTNLEICQYLQDDFDPPKGKLWSLVIKIDCGNKRAGVWWENKEEYLKVARFIQNSSKLTFQGIYAHCGDTYHASGKDDIVKIREFTQKSLISIATQLAEEGITCKDIGLGSTPSCSQVDINLDDPANSGQNLDKIRMTEIHPGNYIFYDNQQVGLGSCKLEEVACRVLTTIIGHYPDRNQILVDCGFLALTKQGLGKQNNKRMIAEVDGHPDIILTDMTQEIGFVESSDTTKNIDFDKYPIGSILKLIPYHSCATSACYEKYQIIQGEDVIDEWKPSKFW